MGNAILIELRKTDGTTFAGDEKLYYPKSHWNNLDGKPANYLAAPHEHVASDITDFNAAVASFGDTRYAAIKHQYHSFNVGSQFYDNYEESNFLRLMTENFASDNLRFQPIYNVEYYDGTNWLAWSGGEDYIKLLLDGNQKTGFNLDHTHRRFRFTVARTTGYPTSSLFVIQETWAGLTFPNKTVTLETSSALSGTYTQKDQMVFNNNSKGYAAEYTSMVHDGYTYIRVTVAYDDWTDSGSYTTIPLRRIMLLHNYNPQRPLIPLTFDYNRQAKFEGGVTFNVNDNTDIVRLNNPTSGAETRVLFQEAGVDKARVRWKAGSQSLDIINEATNDRIAIISNNIRYSPDNSNWYDIYHAGNKPSLSDIGALGLTEKAADSDKLDGLDSSQFVRSDADDTITGKLALQGGRSVYYVNLNGGTSGWVKVARFHVNTAYINAPIELKISQRGKLQIARLHIAFQSIPTTDPNIQYFTYESYHDIGAKIVKNTTSDWSLWIQKSESYDGVTVVDFIEGNYGNFDVFWENAFSSTEPSGTTNYVATRLGVLSSSILQDSTHRFVSDTEKATWNTMTPKTRQVAGIDLQDDVTITELQTALGIGSGSGNYTESLIATLTSGQTVSLATLQSYDAIRIEMNGLELTATGYTTDIVIDSKEFKPSDFVRSELVTGGCSLPEYDTQAACLLNGGSWTTPSYLYRYPKYILSDGYFKVTSSTVATFIEPTLAGVNHKLKIYGITY
ncbi:MAG: hypothetical protein AB7E61_02405 [Acholeplasmataceae bacterium]